MPDQMISQTLVDVAMGRKPADLVVRGGRWISVQSGEIIPDTDIAVVQGRIAYIGPDASHTIGAQTRVIDAGGRYLCPGLLDGHMHVESGMLTVTQFVRAVIPHGTTAMFIDPHEIANIYGLEGVRLMVDEAAVQPIHVWVQVPSCVPSAPGLETPGASIGPEEVRQAMDWTGIIGLGEVMNFPGVFTGDEKMHTEMHITRQAGKLIGGHYAAPDLGLPFHGYAAGGPQDDHEGTRMEDAVARVRQGMRAMLRMGSAWHDVAAQIKAVTEMGLDPRSFILCTDDSHSETLVHEGHVNRAVRVAIASGLRPITAIQMATINTAEYFGLSRDIGLLAPGRWADILILPDLIDMHPDLVLARGEVVAEKGQLRIEPSHYKYPDWVMNSVRLKKPLTTEDFILEAPHDGAWLANVIGVIENQAPTRHMRFEVAASGNKVPCDPARDLAKIALVERHQATGRIKVGLVHGFGFSADCALATTVAHDCHHMIVVGTSEADMALAANALAEMGGGQVVVRDGKLVGSVSLPIAGLMSDEPAHKVAAQAASVLEGFRSCGCKLNNPNMQLSLLALVVIPELRISDLGLVDVTRFEFTPVLVEQG